MSQYRFTSLPFFMNYWFLYMFCIFSRKHQHSTTATGISFYRYYAILLLLKNYYDTMGLMYTNIRIAIWHCYEEPIAKYGVKCDILRALLQFLHLGPGASCYTSKGHYHA